MWLHPQTDNMLQRVTPDTPPPDPNDINLLINLLRRFNGIHELEPDESLTASALYKATDIIERRYYEHVTPDGETHSQQAQRVAGIRVRWLGENLVGAATAYAAILRWQTSKPHLDGMLDPAYTHVGSAMVLDSKARLYVCVTHFGYY